MNSNPNPTIATHVPITAELPKESNELAVGRPDLPTPSLWQLSVQASHKVTKRVAVVARVDWGTNMFRAFYPDEGEVINGKPVGRFSERTEWEHCKDWDVSVTFSPKELERQKALVMLEDEMMKLDPSESAAVMVLVDGDDPVRGLAKLEALRRLGVIKMSTAAAQAVISETKKASK